MVAVLGIPSPAASLNSSAKEPAVSNGYIDPFADEEGQDLLIASKKPSQKSKGKEKAAIDSAVLASGIPPIEVTPPITSVDGPLAPAALDQTHDTAENEFEVDWTQYEAPGALTQLPAATSELIAGIVQSSLQNVHSQIVEDQERRRRTEEEKRQDSPSGEQQGLRKASDGQAPEPSPTTSDSGRALDITAASRQGDRTAKVRPFRRLFRHMHSSAESSADGAKRNEKVSILAALIKKERDLKDKLASSDPEPPEETMYISPFP
jgi:hypothetical protein